VDAIERLRRLRMTASEIAELLALPLSTVSLWLKRIGLGKRSRYPLRATRRTRVASAAAVSLPSPMLARAEHKLPVGDYAPEGDVDRRRHAHTACGVAARQAGRLPYLTTSGPAQQRPERGVIARVLAALRT
jgi:hypothetical protein